MAALLSFIFLNILGAMSPGPDFAVVTRYGLMGTRKAALSATLGITLALMIHVLYCVSGVAIFLQANPKFLSIIKGLGGLYLCYLGLSMFKSTQEENASTQSQTRNAFTAGFLTNLLNPKATVFLLSLFSLFAQSMDTLKMKFAFAASIPLICLTWFSLLSILLTHHKLLPLLQKYQRQFTLIMGALLIVLGLSGLISIALPLF